MPLINFTKEELSKIEYYLLGETDPIVMDMNTLMDTYSKRRSSNEKIYH